MNNRFTRLLAGTLFLTATAFAAPAAMAQDDGFTANVYEGSCDDVSNANVVAELGTLQGEDQNEDLALQWQTLNLETDALPRELLTTATNLGDDVSIENITDGSHVVAIHGGADSDADVVACGEISGEADDEGLIFVDLPEMDDSGWEGRAAFATDSDAAADVTVGVFTENEAQELATPAGTPISTPVATPEF